MNSDCFDFHYIRKNFILSLKLKLIAKISRAAGPLSLLASYLSEFHSAIYQKDFERWSGLIFSLANIMAPG